MIKLNKNNIIGTMKAALFVQSQLHLFPMIIVKNSQSI